MVASSILVPQGEKTEAASRPKTVVKRGVRIWVSVLPRFILLCEMVSAGLAEGRGKGGNALLDSVKGQLGAEEVEEGFGCVAGYEGFKVEEVEVRLVIDRSAWYGWPGGDFL